MKSERHYYCSACHKDFSAIQAADDEPIRHCPRCEHEQVDEVKAESVK